MIHYMHSKNIHVVVLASYMRFVRHSKYGRGHFEHRKKNIHYIFVENLARKESFNLTRDHSNIH